MSETSLSEKHADINKRSDSMTSLKLRSDDFSWIANSISYKGKYAILLVVGGTSVISSAWNHPFSMFTKFAYLTH